MRLVFFITGIISVVLLIIFIRVCAKKKHVLSDAILRMFAAASVAVLANVVLAVSRNDMVSNLAFSFYFGSIDFITYYLLRFTLLYTKRTRFKDLYRKIWRPVIVIDTLSLFVSVWTDHMYSMYRMILSDGSVAFQTRPTLLFNVHLAVCYIPIVTAMVLLALSLFKTHNFYRFKYFPLLISLIGIILLNIVYMLFSLPFDWSVLFYALAAYLLFFFALYFIPRKLMNDTMMLAVDSMKEGLLLFDAEQNCIYINKTARDYFNITADSISVTDYPVSEWIKGTDISDIKDFEKNFHMTVGDEPLRFKVDFRNCTDGKGHHMGSFFLCSDVTKDYILMKYLEDARADANQANVAKSLFLANMSHEIRTPINSVLGMNEMILRESTEEQILEYAEDIKKAGDTLLSLVNNILDLSKIESGKMDINPAPYILQDMLRDCYDMIIPRALQKDLPVTVECEEDIPKELLGDASRIKQVLINLLTNSVKYTQHGQVSIRVSWEKKAEKKGILTIVVSDTGQGISEEDISKLFRVFQRVDEKNNRNVEGSGLGLAISRQLLELMDGTIEVTSTLGKGSDFTVRLPQTVVNDDPCGRFEPEVRTVHTKTVYKESFHAPDARILVVDDIATNLKLISALLKKTEVKVSMADGGEKALKLCAEEEYDLILMDHMMPPPDGCETMKKIREAGGHNATIPIVVLTANAIAGAEGVYLSMGFDDYLSKPVQSKHLEETMLKLLPKEKIVSTEI